MQRVGQFAVILQAAGMGIHLHKVFRPIAVVTTVAHTRVPPLVGNRWRYPDRGCTQFAYVIQATLHALQVATAVLRVVRGIVFTCALVIVVRVTIVEPVNHQEIDHLVTPVG